jgi:hypothetical protein
MLIVNRKIIPKISGQVVASRILAMRFHHRLLNVINLGRNAWAFSGKS